jgi:ankyrin repeat protein
LCPAHRVTNHTDPSLAAFAAAVRQGDLAAARAALQQPEVRARVNDPMFDFGGRALHAAANHPGMVDLLLEHGADLHLRSDWARGPFTVLDHANEASARFLLGRGATLTAHVAARLGWLDELKAIVAANPAVVRERGGDGQHPLHQAATVEIADYLLDRGADLDARCVDHESTPAQYALGGRTAVCRHLLARGATPDIFMAAALGDAALATSLLDADPSCAGARVNEAGYPPVPPGHIYCWVLGFLVSPHEVALQRGHRGVYDVLMQRSPAKVKFLAAASGGDEEAARAALAGVPQIMAELTPADHAQLAQAIFFGRTAAAQLMLALGFDPLARGNDGGTALHMACWMGNAALADQLIARGVPINDRDPVHHSTPLGWAEFGAEHRRADGADYPGTIARLRAAGGT